MQNDTNFLMEIYFQNIGNYVQGGLRKGKGLPFKAIALRKFYLE